MRKEKMLGTSTSIIYVPRHKLSGEYVDESGNMTKHIEDAAGFSDYTNALNYLNDFDEPDSFYLVAKITNIVIIGEPIEIVSYI